MFYRKTTEKSGKTITIRFKEEFAMQLETLRKDMVAAMKAKDKVTKEAVSP